MDSQRNPSHFLLRIPSLKIPEPPESSTKECGWTVGEILHTGHHSEDQETWSSVLSHMEPVLLRDDVYLGGFPLLLATNDPDPEATLSLSKGWS